MAGSTASDPAAHLYDEFNEMGKTGDFSELARLYHECEFYRLTTDSSMAKAMWPGIKMWYDQKYGDRDISMFSRGELIFNEHTGSTYVKTEDSKLLRVPEMSEVDLSSINGHILLGVGNLEDFSEKFKENADYPETESLGNEKKYTTNTYSVGTPPLDPLYGLAPIKSEGSLATETGYSSITNKPSIFTGDPEDYYKSTF